MTENTRLLVLTGVHGKQSGELGSNDGSFIKDCEGQINNLRRKKHEDIEEKKIEFKIEDVGLVKTCDTSTRNLDEDKFVKAVKEFKPTVLVLAFCSGVSGNDIWEFRNRNGNG